MRGWGWEGSDQGGGVIATWPAWGGRGWGQSGRRQGALTGRPRLPPPCRGAEVRQETGNTDQEALSSSKGPMVILLLAKPSLPAKSET